MKLLASLAAILLLVSSLAAQDDTEEFRAPDRGTEIRVHGIQILPATGKPFSGRDHIAWTRTLEDGSVVSTELYAFLARDSQGRIYREHVSFVPVNSNRPMKRREIDLLDPVAHTRTVCIMAKRHCAITNYYASEKFVPPPTGPQDHGTRYLSREVIGTDTIDGFPVLGTRETLTINAGAVGNTQPLVTTKEYWYSPDLEINLLTTRKDPREGTQIIHVIDLSRADPDPSIFQVPANFVVEDDRQAPRSRN
jgi:hypothetical protein